MLVPFARTLPCDPVTSPGLYRCRGPRLPRVKPSDGGAGWPRLHRDLPTLSWAWTAAWATCTLGLAVWFRYLVSPGHGGPVQKRPVTPGRASPAVRGRLLTKTFLFCSSSPQANLKKFMDHTQHRAVEKLAKLLDRGLDPNFHDLETGGGSR